MIRYIPLEECRVDGLLFVLNNEAVRNHLTGTCIAPLTQLSDLFPAGFRAWLGGLLGCVLSMANSLLLVILFRNIAPITWTVFGRWYNC